MLAVYQGWSENVARAYPLTHLLYLNAAILRDLMRRHRVDAGIYRRAPARLRALVESIGLYPGVYMKDYHDFFDTLHLLLALAYAEGGGFGMVEARDADSLFHVGGTSIGTHETKELADLYIHASFIELAADARIAARYAALIAPFACAQAIRRALPDDAATLAVRDSCDALVARLAGAGQPAPRAAAT